MVSLGVFDPVHVLENQDADKALADTLATAVAAEQLGFHRYWVGEQHFDPGHASSASTIVLAGLAARTSTIRLGVATVQIGSRSAMTIAEDFSTLAALYGDRFDIGVGRPAGRYLTPGRLAVEEVTDDHTALWALQRSIALPDPRVGDENWFPERLSELQQLVTGKMTSGTGTTFGIVPSMSVGAELWMMGTGKGQSSGLAGTRGLRFASALHINPAGAPDALKDYRSRFEPSADLLAPHCALTAVVLPALAGMSSLALKRVYEYWIARSGKGLGAPLLPNLRTASQYTFSPREAVFAKRRSDAAFVGEPSAIADGLQALIQDTGVDDLLIYLPFGPAELRCEALEALAADLG